MTWDLRQGHVLDVLADLPASSVHCIVTSPPYWGLRDYKLPPVTWPDGWTGHLGMEPTVEMWTAHLVEVLRAVRRVLRDDGVCWVNLGDSYSNETKWGGNSGGKNKHSSGDRSHRRTGHKPLDIIGQPWLLAFALRADGWYLRSDVIWAKPNPMPESVAGWRWERCRVKVSPGQRTQEQGYAQAGNHRDHTHGGVEAAPSPAWSPCPGCPRCAPNGGLVLRRGAWRPTKGHDYIFMLAKSPDYYADGVAVRELSTERPSGNTHAVLASERGRPGCQLARSIPYVPDGRGRNLRSVWTIATQPSREAHFATFPEALVVPCIKAGTSERGVCASCGAPWARVLERRPTEQIQKKADGWATHPGGHGSYHRNGRELGDPGQCVLASVTYGWRPTCTCGDDSVPATVLDPFAGSGTAGVVAVKLGRRFIGIELSTPHCEMARRRIGEVAPLLSGQVWEGKG